jgi:4-diphosphocytidyl-2-C-methyl-D-erythritol kinase
MRAVSPAKINLHLRVGAVRQDGFHPLHTWMVTVGLFDTLDFLTATDQRGGETAGQPGNIALTCDNALVPVDDRNLVVRAARLLLAEGGSRAPSTSIAVRLAKTIPMGGGLGGGSSNGATALSALNMLWSLGLSLERLSELAASLGSDVPFFLHGPSALCTGQGEKIVPLARPRPQWAVLMLPDFPIATAEAYRRLDALRGNDFAEKPEAEDLTLWPTLPAVDLLPRLANDLEAAAFDLQPALGKLRQAAEEIAGRPVRMSGSGSTLFTLFDTRDGAEAAGQEIQKRLSLKTIAVRIAP